MIRCRSNEDAKAKLKDLAENLQGQFAEFGQIGGCCIKFNEGRIIMIANCEDENIDFSIRAIIENKYDKQIVDNVWSIMESFDVGFNVHNH